MSNKDEIEFLMKLLKHAQQTVDDLTVRIMELQEKPKEKEPIGFRDGKAESKENH